MLRLYSCLENIPENVPYVRDNVEFFQEVTYDKLDERVNGLLTNTDGDTYLDSERFTDKWEVGVSWLDLSTGDKTILNIFYNPDHCFDTLECGKNALTDLKNLTTGGATPNLIWNLDGVDKCDVVVNDDESNRFLTYEEWENG